jgi:hypothetical protein
MKTFIRQPYHSLPSLVALVLSLSAWTAVAQFNGTDNFCDGSNNWDSIIHQGTGTLAIDDCLLEYTAIGGGDGTVRDVAGWCWIVNTGTYTDNWSVQVDVHLDAFADLNCQSVNLDLFIQQGTDINHLYDIAISRTPDSMGFYTGLYTDNASPVYSDTVPNSSTDASLRISFDSAAKTLTASYTTAGNDWTDLQTINVPTDWGMTDKGRFSVGLAAGSGDQSNCNVSNPAVTNGQAFFENFVASSTDTNPPTLTITSPTAGQRVSNSAFTVTGTARDNVAVASVHVQVNGTSWMLAGSSNWFTNWSQNVTLTAGSNYVQAYATDSSGNSSLTNGVSVTYVVTGSLQGILTPTVAVAGGARWQVDGGAWETNGVTMSNLLVGGHSVSFKPVAGFKTPLNQTVSISSNLITQAIGTYFDTNPPTLTVASPTAGQRVSNGVFTVTGTAHDNVAVASVYVQVNGAGWVSGGSSNLFTNWNKSVNLSVGSNYVQAYAADTSGNNSLTNGVSVTYVVTGSLQVTLTPAMAVADGARWQVDNGAWETNGTIISNLLVGSHVVTFKPAAGFKTPTNQTVSISSNVITQAVGTYFDTNPPTLTIVSPTARQRVSNGVFTVTGTAHDNVAVASVHVQISSTGWLAAGSTNSFTNWTNNFTLSPGTNALQAYATDTSGNNSLTNGVQFVFVPSAILTVRTNGANLIFAMQSNLVLQANFVTNPFLAVAGVYSGLFYPTNGVTEASSGFISAAIASNSTGAYTAKLLLDGGSNSFSGYFDLTGTAHTNLARSGKTPVSVTLILDFNPSDALLGGSVSNAAAGWNSVIQADRAVFSATANPATNYAGQFTLLLPPGPAAPAVSPDGYGYAAITNTMGGISTLGGALADGTPFLWSVPMARNGGVPLYQSLYSGKGSLLGWIYFTNEPPQNVSINSSVSWIKPAVSSILYPSGFTNLVTQVLGSFYTNTAKVGVPVLNLTNATLVLSNGNLKGAALIFTNLNIAKNSLTNLAGATKLGETNYLVFAINTNNGVVTVTFQPTGAKTNTVAHGAVLQNETNAAGYFLGTNQSGTFTLDPP